MNKIIMLEVVITDSEVMVFRVHKVGDYRSDVPFGEFQVIGKTTTYLIEGVYNYEQAKRIAIWYNDRLSNRKLNRNRLD